MCAKEALCNAVGASGWALIKNIKLRLALIRNTKCGVGYN